MLFFESYIKAVYIVQYNSTMNVMDDWLPQELTHDKEALQCQVDTQMTAMNALKSQLDSLKVTAAGDTERTSPVSPSLQHQLEQERTALTNSREEVTIMYSYYFYCSIYRHCWLCSLSVCFYNVMS